MRSGSREHVAGVTRADPREPRSLLSRGGYMDCIDDAVERCVFGIASAEGAHPEKLDIFRTQYISFGCWG